jgi:two-component system LytT family sensor kinase
MKSTGQKIMTINFSNKWLKISMHILVWIVLITLPYIIDSNRNRPARTLSPFEEEQFFKLNFISYFYWIALFYLNSNVLIVKFLYQKKYVQYAICFLSSVCCLILVHLLLLKTLLPNIHFNPIWAVWFNLPTFLLTIAASTAYRLISDRIKEEKRILQGEQESMKTELSFLRSQISPHFIFNVLNNIVALVRLKSAELEPTVMKLSGLMQYMLYETDEEKVSIQTEAAYLQGYIDLQQQRFGNKVIIKTHIDLEHEYDEIEPMLLIPFVENAFKHGVGLIKKPEILINLKTANKVLIFSVQNKFNPVTNEIKDPSSGIGLANVVRRLNILYGKEHELLIEKNEDWFSVNLSLKLNV